MKWKPINTEEFLRSVWPEKLIRGERLELRIIQRGTPGIAHRSFEQSIQSFLNTAKKKTGEIERAEVYLGMATRRGNRGAKANCVRVRAVWVDYDGKDLKEKLEKLGDFSPSIVVDSGGGFHLYWIFSTPILLSSEQIIKVEAVNRGICHRIGGDIAAVDITRILRVPGFLNWKYDPPRKVKAYSR